ncbi:12969_t:CDS:1, partial [Funneliformis caledonium]
IVVNAGDLIDMNQENLPISSISTFVTGFATEPVQSDDELFKSIKILVTKFIKGGSSGKKLLIKCRYLKSDERIDKKLVRARKSSNLMITGEILQNLHHSKKQTDEHKKRYIPRPT